MPEIVLITGEIQSGKTKLCLDLLARAKERGIKVGGLISPAVFREGEKTGIDVLDLMTGEQKRLAGVNPGGQNELETKRWTFFPEAVAWGNERLRETVPCDLLILDELGPLEFNRNQGWVNGFDLLEKGEYRTAVVVIRPSLIAEAARRWPASRIIDLDTPGFSFTAASILDSLNLD